MVSSINLNRIWSSCTDGAAVRFFLNELSCAAQAPDWISARKLMDNAVAVLLRAFRTSVCTEAIAHSELLTQPISQDLTVRDWAVGNLGGDRDGRVFLLTVLTKGRHVDAMLDEILDFHECRYDGQDVTESSLAGAAYWGVKLVSLRRVVRFDTTPVVVSFSEDGATFADRDIDNLRDVADLAIFGRRYVPSRKHEWPKAWGTPMDLKPEIAQEVLEQGTQLGGKIYGSRGDQWYVFRSDNAGGYHGYPVDDREVPPTLSRSKR